MKGKKIEIPINNKYIIKNKTPKNREEYLSKPINKKEFKSNKQIKEKFDFCINEKKSLSKVNLFDDDQYKNNIIKKAPKNKTKKRQNKFLKKKLKDREPSSLNSNLNIYKIIHSKDVKSSKLGQKSSSITTDSMNSYISNKSNKVKNNKCISLFNKNDNCNSFKRKRIDSEISNNSNNKKYLNYKKDNTEKVDNTNINVNANTNRYKNSYNKNININNSNLKIKDSHQNIKISMLSPKPIRNINNKIPIKNNNSNLHNNEFKTDVKVKGINNNMIINKSEFDLIFNKNNHNNKKNSNKKNYKKYSKEKNKNNFKDKINKEKEEKYYLNTNKNLFNENIKRYINNKNNDKDKYINNDKKLSINNNNNINKEIYSLSSNNYDNNKFNKLNEKENEKDMYRKKNLNPVKKSLFSEHMHFLINYQDENKINFNNNNYNINNNNFINIPFNSLLDSSDKIDYESKFINYDLGKTTGTSISKDSFFLFANKNNKKNEISKMINLSYNKNVDKSIEEKERTQEEMEKLAKEYLNISKFWENKDEYYKQNINQTNTITTVIDNNNYNDDTIFSDKNI